MIARFWLWAWKWIVAAVALLAAIAAIFLKGRAAGVKTMQPKVDAAKNEAEAAQATIHAQEVRHDVEIETSKLPDAPPQAVGTADPATAAGKLRDDGWTRD